MPACVNVCQSVGSCQITPRRDPTFDLPNVTFATFDQNVIPGVTPRHDPEHDSWWRHKGNGGKVSPRGALTPRTSLTGIFSAFRLPEIWWPLIWTTITPPGLRLGRRRSLDDFLPIWASLNGFCCDWSRQYLDIDVIANAVYGFIINLLLVAR